jgi:hypothetical protein
MVNKKIMIKGTLIVVLLLILSSIVYADVGTTNESMVLYADIIGNGTFYNATSANITIFAPTGIMYVQNAQMSNFGIGKFIYNFTPNESGTWYATASFFNTTNLITVGSQSFAVLNNTGQIVLGAFDMFLAPFLIIVIGILFAVLGQYLKNAVFFIVSGIWFMGSAAAGLIFLNSTIPEMLMYFLVGLALIYHAYDFFQRNAERNQRFVKVEE